MGSDLYEQVFYSLDLIEKDYFGLQFTDANHVKHWLDPTKAIKKQVKSNYKQNDFIFLLFAFPILGVLIINLINFYFDYSRPTVYTSFKSQILFIRTEHIARGTDPISIFPTIETRLTRRAITFKNDRSQSQHSIIRRKMRRTMRPIATMWVFCWVCFHFMAFSINVTWTQWDTKIYNGRNQFETQAIHTQIHLCLIRGEQWKFFILIWNLFNSSWTWRLRWGDTYSCIHIRIPVCSESNRGFGDHGFRGIQKMPWTNTCWGRDCILE